MAADLVSNAVSSDDDQRIIAFGLGAYRSTLAAGAR
jgi:hypothetical protein